MYLSCQYKWWYLYQDIERGYAESSIVRKSIFFSLMTSEHFCIKITYR